MCVCSTEPSHLDDSFEYPQHVFWVRNKKLFFNDALSCRGLNSFSVNRMNKI